MSEHLTAPSPGDALEAVADIAHLLAEATFEDILSMTPGLVIRAVPVASRAELRVTRPGHTRPSTSSAERVAGPAAASVPANTHVLSFPISLQDLPHAGELLLSTQAVGGFEGVAAVTADLLGRQVEAALNRAHAREAVVRLQAGLAGNRDLGVAIGLVMASRGLDREAAFEVLRGICRDSGRGVAEIAADLIQAAESGSRRRPLRLVGDPQV
jgi:hypothetical protein